MNKIDLINNVVHLRDNAADKNHTHDYAVSNHTHSLATASNNGIMSSSDKDKLDNIRLNTMNSNMIASTGVSQISVFIPLLKINTDIEAFDYCNVKIMMYRGYYHLQTDVDIQIWQTHFTPNNLNYHISGMYTSPFSNGTKIARAFIDGVEYAGLNYAGHSGNGGLQNYHKILKYDHSERFDIFGRYIIVNTISPEGVVDIANKEIYTTINTNNISCNNGNMNIINHDAIISKINNSTIITESSLNSINSIEEELLAMEME